MNAQQNGAGQIPGLQRRRARAGIGAVAAPWLAVAALFSWSLPGAASDDTIFVDGFEPINCSLPLTCPAPQAGTSCIAGQLSDAATTQPLHATSGVGLACGSGGAAGGPCDLILSANDALAFEQNPSGSPPLAAAEALVDGCGRFRFSGLTPPPSGGVALVASDSAGSSGHTPTATLHALGANQAVAAVNAVVATSSTVTSWFFLGTIADTTHGLILLSYSNGGNPAVGVTVSPGGSVGAIRYFSDADSQRLLASPAATSTGANGSALVANSPYMSFSGASGGMNVCTTLMTASLPGIVVFAELACNF